MKSDGVRVVFRVDASTEIGGGHVFRCLTLAEELRGNGIVSAFVCREQPGDLIGIIAGLGHTVLRLTAPGGNEDRQSGTKAEDFRDTGAALAAFPRFDWMVVDHYGIDASWEREARRFATNIMVIDDLANRRHDCDVLLDQNYYLNAARRYEGRIPDSSVLLLGPGNALLRKEFHEARPRATLRSSGIRRVLVSYGSSDPTNETEKALSALELADCGSMDTVVVIGSTNPRQHEIIRRCSERPNIQLIIQTNRMAELCLDADLSLGAGGSTMWERCLLGLPTLVIITAENQSEVVEAVTTTGAIVNCGRSAGVTANDLAFQIRSLLRSPSRLEAMSAACFELMKDANPVSSAARTICETAPDRQRVTPSPSGQAR